MLKLFLKNTFCRMYNLAKETFACSANSNTWSNDQSVMGAFEWKRGFPSRG